VECFGSIIELLRRLSYQTLVESNWPSAEYLDTTGSVRDYSREEDEEQRARLRCNDPRLMSAEFANRQPLSHRRSFQTAAD
jgi:hypothetical protein